MELLMMIFGGGATGLLGTLFSRVFDHYEKGAERKFVLQKYKLDAELRARESESEERIAEINSASAMMTASYAHDTGTGTASQWVVDVLRLVRPVLTLLLWILVAFIWFSIADDIQTAPGLPWLIEKASALREQIVGSVIYCATAGTLWWFGTPNMRRAGK